MRRERGRVTGGGFGGGNVINWEIFTRLKEIKMMMIVIRENLGRKKLMTIIICNNNIFRICCN